MRARRDAAVRLLQTAMVASIAIPVAIFCYGAWVTYNNAFAHADEQLSATLDVLAEQANTVFESVALTFTSVDTLVDAMPDDQIKASEQTLHDKLHELEKATEAVSAIRIVDKTGHVLVSSQIMPAPQDQDLSDRDYFAAQVDQGRRHLHRLGAEAALFREPLYRRQPPPAAAERPIFRRHRGVGAARRLYRVLCAAAPRQRRQLCRCSRADGDILARYPPSPAGVTRVVPQGGFMQTLATHPEGGITTSRQTVDGIDRRVGVRKLERYPDSTLRRASSCDRSTAIGCGRCQRISSSASRRRCCCSCSCS